ncbi:hypothetical protein GC197_14550 [bacterium]|nr:hypothetical protein [bacterium]
MKSSYRLLPIVTLTLIGITGAIIVWIGMQANSNAELRRFVTKVREDGVDVGLSRNRGATRSLRGELFQDFLIPLETTIVSVDKAPKRSDTIDNIVQLHPKALQISGSWITDGVLEKLGSLPGLESLTIGKNSASSFGFQQLLSRLSVESLRLSGNAVTPENITSAQQIARLKSLTIEDAILGQRELRCIAGLNGIEVLIVTRCQWSGTIKPCAGIPSATDLRLLAVSEMSLPGYCSSWIKAMPNLETLHLKDTIVAPEIFSELAELKQLKQARLLLCGVQDSDIAALSASGSICLLSADGRGITNNAVNYLDRMPQLQVLSLSNTSITDSCIPKLERLPRLNWLNLPGTVSYARVLELKKRHPNCRVFYGGESKSCEVVVR